MTNPAILALAAARLTRLATSDTLTEPMREWVWDKESDDNGLVDRISFSTLLSCHWCVGLWASLGVSALDSLAGRKVEWLWKGLAMSYSLSILEDKLDS